MKVKYVSIFAIVLVLLSGIPLISGGATNYANAKYAIDTQTQANANECEGGANGANGAINSPQTQSDGSASSPTNLQISKFNDDEDQIGEEAPAFNFLAWVGVIKHVICPNGFVCPTASDFTIRMEDSRPGSIEKFDPQSFQGSEKVRVVTVYVAEEIGVYTVVEDVPPTPAGLIMVQSQSEGCDGIFEGGATDIRVKICTLTNEYRVAPPP